ncbi:MAG: hypothetical protein AB4426_26220 [Xenococcaceae cyanobacterium]
MEFTTVTAINDILLPPLLFILYLCSVSLLLYKPKPAQSQPQRTEETDCNIKDALSSDFGPEPEPEFPVPNTDLHTQAAAILESLNKRSSRRLCKPLGIQQKRNGIEKSLELIKAEIRRQFKESPERVINVIRDHLPELLPQSFSEQEAS